MKKSQAYPSSYLAQDDVREGPIRATIADVRIETIGQGERAAEKPVVHFQEKNFKTFPLNQTNWATIEAIYGEESDAWKGRPIELYLDPGVKFGLETVGGVRVRIPTGADGAILSMEAALAEALKVGMTRDEFVAALKAKGLKGYTPAKDSAVAREVLAAAQAAEADKMDDTIPF
ncbi:MAG TPA: hypothetical protein VMY35_07540 [Phycisphaerae bacterium]|nr:hypothetical protein [Phycisphaerae bacterium]